MNHENFTYRQSNVISSHSSALHNLLAETVKWHGSQIKPFRKKDQASILILCHFIQKIFSSSLDCCCGRYYTENMHISHTEIIVITVNCPLMEFANDFVEKMLPRESTVLCVLF